MKKIKLMNLAISGGLFLVFLFFTCPITAEMSSAPTGSLKSGTHAMPKAPQPGLRPEAKPNPINSGQASNRTLIRIADSPCTPEPTPYPPGTTIYVDAELGDDDNYNGLSEVPEPGTSNGPFRSLHKVSCIGHKGGDQILFRRNRIWSGETLTIYRDASKEWVTFADYGPEDEPKPHFADPPDHPLLPLEGEGGQGWDLINRVLMAQYGVSFEYLRPLIYLAGEDTNRIAIMNLELSGGDMGIYAPAPPKGRVGFHASGLHIHGDRGLRIPKPPGFHDCEDGALCTMWGSRNWCPLAPQFGIDRATCEAKDVWPAITNGSCVHLEAEYATIEDVICENTPGGISGWIKGGKLDNLAFDKNRMGAFFSVSFVATTISNVTSLNGQYPDVMAGIEETMEEGIWFGGVTYYGGGQDVLLTNWEDAYHSNGNTVGDAAAVDLDGYGIEESIGVYSHGQEAIGFYFHDGDGPCIEAEMDFVNKRVVVEDGFCFNNGHEDQIEGGDYLRAAFWALGGFYPAHSDYTLRRNKIYKTFQDQYLVYIIADDKGGNKFNDFEVLKNFHNYKVEDNEIYEYGTYDFPLPIPEPPPTDKVQTPSHKIAVQVSSGQETAHLAADNDLDTYWLSGLDPSPEISFTFISEEGNPKAQIIDEIHLHALPVLGYDVNPIISGELELVKEGGEIEKINVTGGLLSNGGRRQILLREPMALERVTFRPTRYWMKRGLEDDPNTRFFGFSEVRFYQPEDNTPPPTERNIVGEADLDATSNRWYLATLADSNPETVWKPESEDRQPQIAFSWYQLHGVNRVEIDSGENPENWVVPALLKFSGPDGMGNIVVDAPGNENSRIREVKLDPPIVMSWARYEIREDVPENFEIAEIGFYVPVERTLERPGAVIPQSLPGKFIVDFNDRPGEITPIDEYKDTGFGPVWSTGENPALGINGEKALFINWKSDDLNGEARPRQMGGTLYLPWPEGQPPYALTGLEMVCAEGSVVSLSMAGADPVMIECQGPDEKIWVNTGFSPGIVTSNIVNTWYDTKQANIDLDTIGITKLELTGLSSSSVLNAKNARQARDSSPAADGQSQLEKKLRDLVVRP